jgi:ubiquinone/menaquinone biosynthesis C-methylase UbiE
MQREGSAMAYEKSSAFYDAIYSFKDYRAEAQQIDELVKAHLKATPTEGEKPTLLDVACGTGRHAEYLAESYNVTGLDLELGLLSIARKRLPSMHFYHGDMRDFNLRQQFDVVTCLFSSIGYVRTERALRQTLAAFFRHTRPGGVVLVEGWLRPGEFIPGHLSSLFVNEPELKIARIGHSIVDGDLSIMHMHHLVGTPEEIIQFSEDHEMGLFTKEQYMDAVSAAGYEAYYDDTSLTGRGVYIGVRPE